jgi:hypothetical protein
VQVLSTQLTGQEQVQQLLTKGVWRKGEEGGLSKAIIFDIQEVDAGRDCATRMPALPIVTCIGLRATHATYARAHKQHTHKKEQAQEQAQQQAQEQEQEGG